MAKPSTKGGVHVAKPIGEVLVRILKSKTTREVLKAILIVVIRRKL